MTIEETFLLNRELSGEYVVDIHLHSMRWSMFIAGEFTRVLSHFRLMGVSAGIVSDLNEYENPCDNNGRVKTLVEENKDLLLGAVYINPNRTKTAAEMEKELDTCAASGAFTCIKLHPFNNGRQVDDPVYYPVYGRARSLGYPILVHTWGCEEIRKIETVAQKFPQVNFIAGHCGGDLDASMLAGKIAARLDNLYLDYTCSFAYANLLEYLVKKAGVQKILFGSDAAMTSFDSSLGKVVFADISDKDKRDILGLNAKRLFPLLA